VIVNVLVCCSSGFASVCLASRHVDVVALEMSNRSVHACAKASNLVHAERGVTIRVSVPTMFVLLVLSFVSQPVRLEQRALHACQPACLPGCLRVVGHGRHEVRCRSCIICGSESVDLLTLKHIPFSLQLGQVSSRVIGV
jgi:hypothetical protein